MTTTPSLSTSAGPRPGYTIVDSAHATISAAGTVWASLPDPGWQCRGMEARLDNVSEEEVYKRSDDCNRVRQ